MTDGVVDGTGDDQVAKPLAGSTAFGRSDRPVRNTLEYYAQPVRKLLDRVGGAALAGRSSPPGSPVLMFHEVDTRPANSFSNATSPEQFAELLEVLDARYDVLPLSSYCERLEAGTLRPEHCALTFDDGARSNYVHAYPILRDLDVPATVFLATDCIDDDHPFWPYVFNFFLSEFPQRFVNICRAEYGRPRLRRAAVKDFTNFVVDRDTVTRVMNRAFGELCSYDSYREAEGIDGRVFLDECEIAEMAESGLVEFGVHTASHPRLKKLGRAGVEDELRRSLQRFDEVVPAEAPGRPDAPSLAAPFGGLGTAYGTTSIRTAERLGINAVFSAYGGTNRPGQPSWSVRRIAVMDRRIDGDPEALVGSLEMSRPRFTDRVTETLYLRKL
jgi:peptidoglycan/xylan/chitin deacetylase (PgdA/CDA1 family)